MAGPTNTARNKSSNVESNMEFAYTDEHFPSKRISSAGEYEHAQSDRLSAWGLAYDIGILCGHYIHFRSVIHISIVTVHIIRRLSSLEGSSGWRMRITIFNQAKPFTIHIRSWFLWKDNNSWRSRGWDTKNNQRSIHCHTYNANYQTSLFHIRLLLENEDELYRQNFQSTDKAGHETLW